VLCDQPRYARLFYSGPEDGIDFNLAVTINLVAGLADYNS
jgi:hypothetical protein